MKIVFLILFLLSCRANLINRTVGYKEYPQTSNAKLLALLEEPTFNLMKVTIEDKPDIIEAYKEKLKQALSTSVVNSGQFSEVQWKKKEQLSDNSVSIEFRFSLKEDMRIGQYTYYPEFFFLYLPFGETQNKNEKIFWPTYIPGFWPASGYFPLLAKSGTVTVELQTIFKEPNKNPIFITISKSEDYSLLFYGVYRTSEVEEKSILAIERSLEDLSLKLADLELQTNIIPAKNAKTKKRK